MYLLLTGVKFADNRHHIECKYILYAVIAEGATCEALRSNVVTEGKCPKSKCVDELLLK